MRPAHLFISLIIIPLLAFGLHKHYISLTQIDYVKEKKALQITMRFFIDDIESALEKQYQEPMELSSEYQHKLADQYLETYIDQNFDIWIDGQELAYTFIGKEYENDEVFFYLEIEKVDQINGMTVKNNMLLEEFENQQNYIKLNINDVQKTLILVQANNKEALKL